MSLVLDSSATLAFIYSDETTESIRRVFDAVANEGAVVPALCRLEVRQQSDVGRAARSHRLRRPLQRRTAVPRPGLARIRNCARPLVQKQKQRNLPAEKSSRRPPPLQFLHVVTILRSGHSHQSTTIDEKYHPLRWRYQSA